MVFAVDDYSVILRVGSLQFIDRDEKRAEM
jgi:hypothetical protein